MPVFWNTSSSIHDLPSGLDVGVDGRTTGTHLVAALASPVWHSRKRTSLRDLVKAYLADIVVWIAVVAAVGWM